MGEGARVTIPAPLTDADLGYIRRRVGEKPTVDQITALWDELGSKHRVVVELLTQLLAKRRAGADSTTVPGSIALSYGTSIKALQEAIAAEQALADAEAATGDPDASGATAQSYSIARTWTR